MPIYEVSVEVHDGEHEYIQNNYVFCRDVDKAIKEVIELYEFNNKEYFRIYEHDPKTNKPIAWEGISDYRIYGIENAREAKLSVIGLSNNLDLTQLMHRPVLPLFSVDADWIWQYDNEIAYWWQQGDIVLEVLKNPVRFSSNDSCIKILYWSYFDFKDHVKEKQGLDYKLVKGKLENEDD